MSYITSLAGAWRDADSVCALADDERHLGHLIRRRKWHAYDATRPGKKRHGFRYLGAFTDLSAAKQAVELAVWRTGELTMSAGSVQ